LTARQLQNLLQVDRITIYRMLNDGRLHGFKVGGQWRFSRQAIEKWLQERQADLEVANLPQKSDHLDPSPQALPLSCIQAIQGIFAEAMSVGSVTTAVNGTPLTPVANACEFCSLILSTKSGRQKCIDSWRAAAGGHRPIKSLPGLSDGTAIKESQSSDSIPELATCHAGLRYVWGRIEVQGAFVAATHAGQFLTSPPVHDNTWSERLTALADTTSIDVRRLQDALERVHILSENRQHQIPRLLQRVTDTFSEIGEERLSLLGRLQRIAEMTGIP
jgi:excisionase family DNA binding protein